MQDEEIVLCNACTDLVSLKKCEAFPLRLLGGKRLGEWVGTREFCQQIGVNAEELPAELFTAWLPDPKAHDGYVVILFYDDESKWSMVAHYNRARLTGDALPNQPTGAIHTASPGSTSQPTDPAAEL